MFRANDPKAYADQITRDVLSQIFPPSFHPTFNQYISINTSLAMEKFEALDQPGVNLRDAIRKIRENKDDFMNHEIDAVIYVHSGDNPEKWIEMKLFTCPDQTTKVLERHLQPAALQKYFFTNDYLGLMGFSLLYANENTPLAYQKVRPQLPPEITGSWVIHLILIDKGICNENRSARELGECLLDQIRYELTELKERLGLNNYSYFFKLSENFVKVVKMMQVIEEYKSELEQERREKEQERREKEKYKEILRKHGLLPDDSEK